MRVLLVEDDPRLARLVEAGLQYEGCSVDIAASGPEGLAQISAAQHDVVVLDAMLPGLDGFEVCRIAREEGVATPILMLTAHGADAAHVRALDIGADDFLVKPCSIAVLVAHIRAVTRRVAPSREVLIVGDLVLDVTAQTCRRGSTPIELSSRQAALLAFLMSHAGRPVSKPEIVAAVWEGTVDDDTNVVEVYIGYLRRKVDAPFSRSSIVTVRHAGYMILDDSSPDVSPDALTDDAVGGRDTLDRRHPGGASGETA